MFQWERSSSFLWYDNWHPHGPLLDVWGNEVLLASGLHINSKLSYVIRALEWCWLFTTNLTFIFIQSDSYNIVPYSQSLDSSFWAPSNDGIFSSPSMWNYIRPVALKKILGPPSVAQCIYSACDFCVVVSHKE